MLHKLVEYAEGHGIRGEQGFTRKRIRWLLNFSSGGKYLGIVEQNEPGTKAGVGREFSEVPHLKFAGDTPMRQFLVDTAQYALLYGDKNKKVMRKHEYFLKLLQDAGDADPFLAKVAKALMDKRVLERIHQDLDEQTPKAKSSDNITFAEISSGKPRIVVHEKSWHKWWRTYYPTLFKKRELSNPMLCMISGETCDPAPTHPKIKGIGRDVGGKEETTLVGFNLDAFCSYGLKQSTNSAIKPELTEQYAAALNELIARHAHRLTGTKIVYWYAGNDEVPSELDPLSWLLRQSDEESVERVAHLKAKSLLGLIRSGGRTDLLNYSYYSMTLSGSSARVVVRDWIEGQFGDLVANIDKWFNDFAITHRDGYRLAPRPKFLAVLAALERELKYVSPPVEARMWNVAVRNQQIPEFAMAKALARVKVDIIQDQDLNHARFGLLKAYHIRKGEQQMQPYLNEDHPNPAYHCGRLMAVYADLQRSALGNVGAGIVQRYYAAASATPALIFGRLSRGSQFHLNKLEGGLVHWYEQRLASIWAKINDTIPKTLTLEEQSLFALGYYQQMAASKKSEKEKDPNSQEKKGE